MLLEEVRCSPSFVEEDFRLLWKIARHLELSERVRDLSFNLPLSSLPCCMTPSTSQCWCLARLYACCLFVYLLFLPIDRNFLGRTRLRLPRFGSSHTKPRALTWCCRSWIEIRRSDFILILHNYFCGMINVTCSSCTNIPAAKGFVLNLEPWQEY